MNESRIDIPNIPREMTREQVIQVCETLGLPASKLVDLRITPSRVTGELLLARGVRQTFEARVK